MTKPTIEQRVKALQQRIDRVERDVATLIAAARRLVEAVEEEGDRREDDAAS